MLRLWGRRCINTDDLRLGVKCEKEILNQVKLGSWINCPARVRDQDQDQEKNNLKIEIQKRLVNTICTFTVNGGTIMQILHFYLDGNAYFYKSAEYHFTHQILTIFKQVEMLLGNIVFLTYLPLVQIFCFTCALN